MFCVAGKSVVEYKQSRRGDGMGKKKQEISNIIETRKYRAGAYANSVITLMYWEVGHYVNSIVLNGSRAAYGKRIVAELASKLSWSHFIEIVWARFYICGPPKTHDNGRRRLHFGLAIFSQETS